MDNDGFVSNGELFQVLKMMVGNNLKDTQLQQIVDKTILLYDKVTSSLKKKTKRKTFPDLWSMLSYEHMVGLVDCDSALKFPSLSFTESNKTMR